ncbi:MAG: hypothetical protein Q8N23_04055 [Archangium sp.]|nr:hypothetical protein [Archangium sp.]MDP3151814.1 hypothetical protein [Archangium sp.]MDP3573332.1 hypothetical protein [Archangium sp.]
MHHHARHILAFSAAAIIGAFVGCSATPPACSPATCAGCCDAAGACQAGASNSACGNQGNGCVSCQVATNCEFGTCRTSTAVGGGGGGSTGGGTGTGGGSMGGGTGSTGGGTGGGSTGGGTGGGSMGGGSGGGSMGGGAGGGSTGGGGGGVPMFDAGTIARPDGGTLTPPTVVLTFANDCGAVSNCAGNEVDAWAYSTGCIDDSAFSRVTSAAMQLGCTATVTNKNGAISGSAVFDGTAVHRAVVGQVNFTLSAGGNCSNPLFCNGVQGQLGSFGLSGTCAVVGTECVCQLSFDIGQSGSQSYTYTAGQLTTANPTETYDSCITGSVLTYRETTDGGIPGVFSLSK